jgi:Holliday junction DNA helicase RuvA
MISSLTGELQDVEEDRVQLRVGPIVLELLIPAVDATALQAQIGEELTFHTIFYLQGDSGGGNIEPRLIGFLRVDDKRFFEKFITVKGIGPKTALRALTVSVGEIAQAIESKDARFLLGLDGIGKRTAELIIAELAGKVKDFAAPFADAAGPRAAGPGRRNPVEEDAIATLIALGERRADAEHLLDRARAAAPALKTTESIVSEMLRLRSVRA